MELPPVFISYARNPHHTPDLPLPSHVAQQHRQQLVHVQTIGLGSAVAPIHFNAGRIDDAVVDAAGNQITVQPEAITPRFITAPHRRIGRQLEAFLGLGDFHLQARQVPAWQRSQARLLPQADCEPQFPISLAELESQVQNAGLCGNVTVVGR